MHTIPHDAGGSNGFLLLIKGLEADQYKWLRNIGHQKMRLAVWSKPITDEQAFYTAGQTDMTGMQTYWALEKKENTVAQPAEHVIADATSYFMTCDRWLAHIKYRLEYERAMLAYTLSEIMCSQLRCQAESTR